MLFVWVVGGEKDDAVLLRKFVVVNPEPICRYMHVTGELLVSGLDRYTL